MLGEPEPSSSLTMKMNGANAHVISDTITLLQPYYTQFIGIVRQ